MFSGDGPLWNPKAPVGDSGELEEIDSYAPRVDRYGPDEASGLTWDGNKLWLLVGDLLSKLDGAAQPICRIELSSVSSWGSWRGLAWDGQFLWVADMESNRVYRVDAAACR